MHCLESQLTLKEGEGHGEEEGPGADLVLGKDPGGGGVEVAAQLVDESEVEGGHLDQVLGVLTVKQVGEPEI